MLSGSAIVRVSVLLVAAGLLAALTQFLWLRGPDGSSAEIPTVAAPSRERVPEPPRPPPGLPEVTAQEVQPAPAVPETAPPPSTAAEPAPAPLPVPVPDPTAQAEERAEPRAVALVDLNTATLAQLNALKGGGNIGRAIIQKRPYASVDQLLGKRVLSRSTYERIKDQVTVQ